MNRVLLARSQRATALRHPTYSATLLATAALGFALLGCEPSSRQTSTLDAPVDTPAAAPPAATGDLPAAHAPPAAAPAGQSPPAPTPAAQAPPAVAPAPQQNMVREEAKAGVGQKGRSLEYKLGQTAAKTYFAARERTVFEIQIPSAMNLYKASNGHAPKTHDDFMRDIIQANQISLPTLPTGHKFVYDPEKEELYVEHPQGN